ncbi:glutaminase, partial [Francisella tularensis subsp. holarctica]|uniref:glutaminase n=1 Tax=Francisella tularensis TaxID=263 RepID=UPI002381BB3F
FTPTTILNCLSMMYSCWMYDFSGEYAFSVGLPAKSGVSGALAIAIPNVGGFEIFSPRLDPNHNSVRGGEFSKRLIEKFSLHNYDHRTH